MGKDRSKDGDAATSSADNKDHSRDQESRDATLARTIAAAVAGAFRQQKSEETQSITKAVALQTKFIIEIFSKQKAKETQSITEAFSRQMEKTHAQYEELLKASCAQNFPSTLKFTSSSEGFRVMNPFDWTMDKNIYQRWQLWSHKARLTLDAMEGDTENTKISYLHHWLNGNGILVDRTVSYDNNSIRECFIKITWIRTQVSRFSVVHSAINGHQSLKQFDLSIHD